MENVERWDKFPLPERIKEARLVRGLTQKDISVILNITKQAVCQYESGVVIPRPEALKLMSQELNIPYNFFFKKNLKNFDTPIFFRKRKTASKKFYEMFKTRIKWSVEIYDFLTNYIDFSDAQYIRLSKNAYSLDEIQEIADVVRKEWGLGKGPISNLTLLLENNGFVLSKIKLDSEKVDACSTALKENNDKYRPALFYTADTSGVRLRRTLAHELGHQILHSHISEEDLALNYKQREREADWFASSFLMPRDSFAREVYSLTSLDNLLALKERWMVSAQSIVFYLHEIDLISENQFNYLKTKMYSRGWRVSEPLDNQIPCENPSMLYDAVRLVLDNKIITVSDFVEKITFPQDEIENLCHMESGSLTVDLPIRKNILKLVK